MKMKKIAACALSAVAAAGMMLGSTAFASDISGHYAEPFLQQFIDAGYMSGYTDGTYKPNNTIVRSELASLLNTMQGYTTKADVSKYKDVIPGQWYYNHVANVVGADIMIGTNDTAWSPNSNVTREQVCVIVCKLQGLELDTKSSTETLRAELKKMGYQDTDKISDWAMSYVYAAVKEGYMVGTDTKMLNAQKSITRADTVILLCKCMQDEGNKVYVMMNIPYADFYRAELSGNAVVDTVTSATKSKTLTGTSLAAGTYHVNSDGSDITGVSYPVRISENALKNLNQITDSDSFEVTVTNRGETSTQTYTGIDALFGAESYSYYLLDEKPENYKVATVNGNGKLSFGKAIGEVTTVEDPDFSFATSSSFGDYELVLLDELPFEYGTDTIYAVAVNTKEGDSYGLRAIENIWLGVELGWCTTTKDVHGSPTSCDPYIPMMGQTITSLTYYTSKGIYNLDIQDTYVPTKLDVPVSVGDTPVSAGTASITAKLPSDFQPTYTIHKATASEGRHGITYTYDAQTDLTVDASGVITWDKSKTELAGNMYHVVVADKSGKYVEISGDFNLTDGVAEPKTYTGTLTGTATVTPDEDEGFTAYKITVTLTVENNIITDLKASGVSQNDATYSDRALNGTTKKTGMVKQYVGQSIADAATYSVDAVSLATCSSNAIQAAVRDAIAQAG